MTDMSTPNFDWIGKWEVVQSYPHLIQHNQMPGTRFKAVLRMPGSESEVLLEHYEGMYTRAPFTQLNWLGNKYATNTSKVLYMWKPTYLEVNKDVTSMTQVIYMSDAGLYADSKNMAELRLPFDHASSAVDEFLQYLHTHVGDPGKAKKVRWQLVAD